MDGRAGRSSSGIGGGVMFEPPLELLELLELLPVPGHSEASLASVPSEHLIMSVGCSVQPIRKTRLIASNDAVMRVFMYLEYLTACL